MAAKPDHIDEEIEIAGDQLVVSQADLFQNCDFAVVNDSRTVLGGMFQRLYGLSVGDLPVVFPVPAPRGCGLISV